MNGLYDKLLKVQSGVMFLNREEFTKLFNEALNAVGITDLDLLSDMFKAPHTTIKRWKEGTVAPHPLVWPAIFGILADVMARQYIDSNRSRFE